MAHGFSAGLLDRLLDDRRSGAAGNDGQHSGQNSAQLSLEELKDSIACDLEALLNTRAAFADTMFAAFPTCSASIVNYGLIDFAGMCLTSSVDQDRICAAVKAAIERHEPRLHGVSATLRKEAGTTNRVSFVIAAMLETQPATEAVRFDAVLQSSTQQYAITQARPGTPRGAA